LAEKLSWKDLLAAEAIPEGAVAAQDAAKALGLTKQRVSQLIQKGDLVVARRGAKRVWVTEASVQRLRRKRQGRS
jgi:hypothetical protein